MAGRHVERHSGTVAQTGGSSCRERPVPVTVKALSFKKLKRPKSILNDWEPLKKMKRWRTCGKKGKHKKGKYKTPLYTPPSRKMSPRHSQGKYEKGERNTVKSSVKS